MIFKGSVLQVTKLATFLQLDSSSSTITGHLFREIQSLGSTRSLSICGRNCKTFAAPWCRLYVAVDRDALGPCTCTAAPAESLTWERRCAPTPCTERIGRMCLVSSTRRCRSQRGAWLAACAAKRVPFSLGRQTREAFGSREPGGQSSHGSICPDK